MDDQEKRLTRRKMLIAGAGLTAVGAVVARSLEHPTLTLAAGADATSTGSGLPVKAIEAVFGVKGTIEPGGVLKIDLDREDLHPVIFGVPVKPDNGFDTEITFQAISSGAIVKYE